MKKHVITIFLLGSLGMNLSAQEIGMYFMGDVYQSGFQQPGRIMKDRLCLNPLVSGVNMDMANNGPSFNKLVSTNADGQHIINLNDAVSRMPGKFLFRMGFNVETLNFGLRLNKLQIGVSHAIRMRAALSVPKEFFEVGINGNAQYIDQTVGIGPRLDARIYGEWGFHGAYRINPELSVGAKVKILSGVADISTGNHHISLRTDSKYYEIQANTDWEIRKAGVLVDMEAYANPDGAESDIEFFPDSLGIGDWLFPKNRGFALDLGVEYKFSEKLTLAASVLDLGRIKWKKSVKTFGSKGEYVFDGVDVGDVILNNEQVDFDGTVDSLVGALELDEVTGISSYSTVLPRSYFISATYEIIPRLQAGALLYGDHVGGRFNPALGVSIRRQFGRIFSLGASYSIRSRAYNNLGLNWALNLGPLQFYMSSDNLFGTFSPKAVQATNFRVGLNIAIGRGDDQRATEPKQREGNPLE